MNRIRLVCSVISSTPQAASVRSVQWVEPCLVSSAMTHSERKREGREVGREGGREGEREIDR